MYIIKERYKVNLDEAVSMLNKLLGHNENYVVYENTMISDATDLDLETMKSLAQAAAEVKYGDNLIFVNVEKTNVFLLSSNLIDEKEN